MRIKASLTICSVLPFLVFAFLPAKTWAQEQSDDKKDSRIMIRVICSQPVEGATELKLTQGDIALHDIAVIPSLLTDPMAVKRGEITLARHSGGADKPVFDHILKVTIPATGSRFILALFPSAEASPNAPYQHRLIRTDGLRFNASDIYVFNLTKIPVAGGLGKSPFRLEAGASQVVTPVSDGADTTMYQARFFYSDGGKPRIFNDTRWPLAATARIYLFFIPDPARNSMGYVSFREYGTFE